VTYAYLYHQKQMLEDHHRMVSYRNAILHNKARFKDAVVLDVGTGSGVLAIWAAQAGARKVYAGAGAAPHAPSLHEPPSPSIPSALAPGRHDHRSSTSSPPCLAQSRLRTRPSLRAR
jgi:hypothetical protein